MSLSPSPAPSVLTAVAELPAHQMPLPRAPSPPSWRALTSRAHMLSPLSSFLPLLRRLASLASFMASLSRCPSIQSATGVAHRQDRLCCCPFRSGPPGHLGHSVSQSQVGRSLGRLAPGYLQSSKHYVFEGEGPPFPAPPRRIGGLCRPHWQSRGRSGCRSYCCGLLLPIAWGSFHMCPEAMEASCQVRVGSCRTDEECPSSYSSPDYGPQIIPLLHAAALCCPPS
jgi:hypothetical protein